MNNNICLYKMIVTDLNFEDEFTNLIKALC
jgi:hypothetical protein